MAKNDNVIGLAIGLDTSNLKAGLLDAGRRIKEAGAEFKATTAGMDDWQKSSEGLNAKLKQLNSNLKVQNAALDLMQKEYDEMYKGQDENSTAAVKLRTEILNQKAAIGRTEKDIRKYTDSLEEVRKSELDVDKSIDKTNKSLKEQDVAVDTAESSFNNFKATLGSVAKSLVTGLGVAIAGLATSFIGLAEGTREYREDMSKLDAAFKGAGHGAETANKTYKELFSVIGESDTAVEASQQIALLAKSEEEAAKWAELAAGVTGTFGDALKPETFYEAANETLKLGEATGAFTQMLEGTGMSVDEFNKGLAACSTETEKQAYMLAISEQAMGKAGEAYRETNKDIIEAQLAQSQLTDSLANLGAIAEPVLTTLKLLAADLLTSFTPFVELMANGLQAAFAGNANGATMLAEGIGGILNSLILKVNELLPMLLGVIVQLAPVITQTLLDSLPILLQTVLTIFTSIMTSLSEMLPTLIPIIIDTMLMLVDTLIDNLDMLIDAALAMILALADGLIAAIPKLTEKIPTIITKLVDAIARNLPKIIQAGITILLNLGKGLIQAIPELLKSIPTIITSLFDSFNTYKDSLKDIGKNLLEGLWNGIKDKKEWLKKKVKAIAEDVTGWFKDVFGIKSPSVVFKKEIGMMLGLGVGEGLVDSSKAIKKDIDVFNKEVLNGFDVSANQLDPGVISNGNSGVVSNTNFTQIINAPKQPSVDELYRNTKNLFNLKVVTTSV